MRFPLELNPFRCGFVFNDSTALIGLDDSVEDLKDLFTVGTLTEHGHHDLLGHLID